MVWKEVKEVYIWSCKVRPTNATVEWLLVWWGWAWGRSRYRAGWWGWAGWLIYCACDVLQKWARCCVVIWAWGTWSNTNYLWACWNWWNSCFWTIVAYWWWWGGWMYTCACGCPWAPGWSGWWAAWCNTTCASACAWQWNIGWPWCLTRWWWGGWACCAWCVSASSYVWWAWWWWKWYSIDWTTGRAYSWWWWWGWCTTWGAAGSGTWWCGWCYRCPWKNAINPWSWWGWGWCTGCSSCCMAWWNGADGTFIARYPCTCWYNITWGCKYLCNWYCIHCFTSDGTLCVN